MKSEGASLLPSASKSKPGSTVYVKKDGGSSSKIPTTPMAQNRLKPKAAHHGAHTPTPTVENLFNNEARTSSSKTSSGKHPVYTLSSHGRPPSVDIEEHEKQSSKVCSLVFYLTHLLIFFQRGRAPSLQPPRKSAKTRADANPPAGETDKPDPCHISTYRLARFLALANSS
jgi:hypothetical protein